MHEDKASRSFYSTWQIKSSQYMLAVTIIIKDQLDPDFGYQWFNEWFSFIQKYI
jgi:hypothetical protein